MLVLKLLLCDFASLQPNLRHRYVQRFDPNL